jgi:hypothetical protein
MPRTADRIRSEERELRAPLISLAPSIVTGCVFPFLTAKSLAAMSCLTRDRELSDALALPSFDYLWRSGLRQTPTRACSTLYSAKGLPPSARTLALDCLAWEKAVATEGTSVTPSVCLGSSKFHRLIQNPGCEFEWEDWENPPIFSVSVESLVWVCVEFTIPA